MKYMRQENAGSGQPLGTPRYITVHWTANDHDTVFDHYHFNVKGNGTVVQTLSVYKLGSHVWHRNPNNIGVAFCAMGSSRYDINQGQMEVMARLIAELMGIFNISLINVKDHVYWACLDDYGPGSGDPETRIDISGTLEGQKLWDQLIKRVEFFRSELQAGRSKNSLVGRIN